MLDGLYAMKFRTPLGTGAGVVVKHGDKLFGGDSGFAWVGEIADDAGTLTATAKVTRHDAGMASLFGALNDFRLNLSGSLNRTSAQLQGTSPEAPGVALTLNLTLLAEA